MDGARLPLMFAALLALFGASRFEATRPIEAFVIGLGLPIGVALRGLGPFRDASDELRRAALALGVAFVLVTEGSVLFSLIPSTAVLGSAHGLALVAIGLLVLVLGLELFGVRRGLSTRCTAWLAIPSVFALWLARHELRDPFAAVFGAVFVGLLLGGGSGLLAGVVGAKLVRRP